MRCEGVKTAAAVSHSLTHIASFTYPAGIPTNLTVDLQSCVAAPIKSETRNSGVPRPPSFA